MKYISDSQAVLKAVQKRVTENEIIRDYHNILNNMGKRTKYQVIGSQATTAMNDSADALA